VGDDRWVPPVGGREGGIGYRFGKGLPGPRALFLFWAEGFPRGPFRIFLSFFLSSFSFSVSCLLLIFFKIGPN
jgi:hypothetical protein